MHEATAAEPRPRRVAYRIYGDGERLLVDTDDSRWFVAIDDDEAVARLGALIRSELHGPSAGCC